MERRRTVMIIVYEWASIIAIMILASYIFFAIVGRVTKKARAIEAVSNIGTLAASLERCALVHNSYAGCQGGFLWDGHWNLDIANPSMASNAFFEYGVWADSKDWVIAARPKDAGKKGYYNNRIFIAMSTYSRGKVVFCGFDQNTDLCDELRTILPRRKEM